MNPNLPHEVTLPASCARERIRAVAPDVIATFERMETRVGARFFDADLLAVSKTQEFLETYRAVTSSTLTASPELVTPP